MPKAIRTSRYLIVFDPDKEDCGQDIENVNEETNQLPTDRKTGQLSACHCGIM